MSAGGEYRGDKNWDQAAEAYAKAAALFQAAGLAEASLQALEASCSMRLASPFPDEHETAWRIHEEHLWPAWRATGRLQPLCNGMEAVADAMASDLKHAGAAEVWTAAAEINCSQGWTSSALKCLSGVAAAHIALEDYHRALAAYETAFDACVGDALLRFSAGTYASRVVMCALAMGDSALASLKLTKFKEVDSHFLGSHEAQILDALIGAFNHQNKDAFMSTVLDYDSVKRLDPQQTRLLLEVKSRVTSQDVEF
jgi:tetratricopeptide (TPR) repeat protein